MLESLAQSVVRTVVPILVGFIVAAGLKVGLHLENNPALVDLVTVAVTSLYYAGVRYAEEKYSDKFGWLLGSVGAPQYGKDDKQI